MRKFILSVTTIVLIATGISIGSMIQAASRATPSTAGTLSPHEMMVKLGRDLAADKPDSLF